MLQLPEEILYRQNNILYNLQFGFRASHTINHARVSLTESAKNTLDSKNFRSGIFFDLKKAFETVHHQILLKKLDHYRVRGIALSWLNSYLSNREQYISVNGYNPCSQKVTCCVPQGSVLGPLLILIFVNDISKTLSKSSFSFFC